jgi:hypothetical protein
VDDGQPPFSGGGISQERREPSAARAASREHVEPGGVGRVRGLSQEPGVDQGLERLLDLREIIPDVLGQALADEVGSRMAMEEQQQIEIAGVLQAPDTVKEVLNPPRRHQKLVVCPPSRRRASGCETLTGRTAGSEVSALRELLDPAAGKIVEVPEVGGLHHRYLRQAA